jgi:hypothetical protein
METKRRNPTLSYRTEKMLGFAKVSFIEVIFLSIMSFDLLYLTYVYAGMTLGCQNRKTKDAPGEGASRYSVVAC